MGALLKSAGSYSATLDISVKVASAPTSFEALVMVYINPQGKTRRLAKDNEAKVELYHVKGGGSDVLLGSALTATVTGVISGTAHIVYNSALPALPAEYKVVATHVTSGAQVEKHFNLDANGALVGEGTVIVKNAGTTMSADFSQLRRHSLIK